MILDQLVDATRRLLGERKGTRSLAEVKRLARSRSARYNFEGALVGEGIKLIAEVKRASPSRGWLRPHLDAAGLALEYARGGAAAISVLTEESSFKGSFVDLATVRDAVALPLLCKDFIIDPYQLYEARASGADAILLIAAVLSGTELRELVGVVGELDICALIEVHSERELERALDAGPCLIGINNRNLEDFSVDLRTTSALRPLVPAGITVVSESGIRTRGDIICLEKAGVDAVLVGETLVASSDACAEVGKLLGIEGR